MGSLRLVLAVVLLAAGVAAAGAAYVALRPEGEGASGAFRVEVVGPEGILVDAVVRVENATALSALEAAAAQAGLGVELDRYPGMGAYVRAIGPHEARGAGGWIYEVHRGGAWIPGDRSGERWLLQEGDALRWRWTDG